MSRAAGPRLLLAAYQCGPGMGSVSEIGWQWYSRLGVRVPTTLVTHVRNREALVRAGAPVGDSEVVYIDTEWFAGPLYRVARRLFPRSEHPVFLVSSLDFFVYDRIATARLLRRVRAGERWDVVHAVTPVSPAAPTRLHRLGAPVVLGPLNGNLPNPPAFPDIMREESAWLYPVRHLARALDWATGSTRHAAMILTATRATAAGVPRRHRAKCVAMIENGVDLRLFASTPWPRPPSASEPLRVLFVGRLMPFKGVPMLLEAVARVRAEIPVSVTIVGDGPMASAWQLEARERGVEDLVTFAGPRPRDEVAQAMQETHVFCLPSVRESGGAVLLEAMACARPVIAVAFGGPAELVDDQVGCAVAPLGHETVVAAIAAALRDVVRDPDAWRRRGEEGRRRAEERYGWDAKVEEAIRLYRLVGAADGAGSVRERT